jgi:ferritin-like metal-binding protein YciE
MPSQLDDLYQQEIGDLISANIQMQRLVERMASKAQDEKVKHLLTNSVQEIGKHTETLRGLHKSGQETECRAMAGLVDEAQRHAVDADLPPQLRDVAMLAHYQRMGHYGVAGFGTAAAYARALGRTDEATKLSEIVSDIYDADEYSTKLAEAAERAAAAKA